MFSSCHCDGRTSTIHFFPGNHYLNLQCMYDCFLHLQPKLSPYSFTHLPVPPPCPTYSTTIIITVNVDLPK